jgi:hypothetical protein
VADQRVYAPEEGRHSNLPPQLKHQPSAEYCKQGFPKSALSVRVTNAAELRNLLDWYERFGSVEATSENSELKHHGR